MLVNLCGALVRKVLYATPLWMIFEIKKVFEGVYRKNVAFCPDLLKFRGGETDFFDICPDGLLRAIIKSFEG